MGRIWIAGRTGELQAGNGLSVKTQLQMQKWTCMEQGGVLPGDRRAFVCVCVGGGGGGVGGVGADANPCVFAWRGMEDGRGVMVVG